MCHAVKLTSVIVCNLWRTVDASNNTFVIAALESGTVWTGTFVIHHGNYSAMSLVNELAYQLNSSTANWVVSMTTGSPPSKPDGTWTVQIGAGGQTQDPWISFGNRSGNVRFYLVMELSSAARLLGFMQNRPPYYTYWGD